MRRVALWLARMESADLFVTEMAALLHDVDDWKFAGGADQAHGRETVAWLFSLGVEPALATRICEAIDDASFKGAGVSTPARSREAAVVQDADRLDALGAIGIARAFAYGGARNQPIHDPERSPRMHRTFSEYKQGGGTSINHFYEKLLLLPERMQTPAGRQLARERREVMKRFLENFCREWDWVPPAA
ncbi:MAG TPA: HD domain-containing protein [Chthoniobacterales bacterium]